LARGKVDRAPIALGKWTVLLLLLPLALVSEGCNPVTDMQEASNSCFQKRPAVVRPDPQKVYPNLSTGAAGVALVEAIFAGKIDAARAQLAQDRRLIETEVRFDPKMQSAPTGQYGDLLTFAVAACNSEMLQMLLESGAAPDGVQRGQALTLSLLADSPAMAEILMNAGASPDPQKLGGAQAMREQFAFGNVGGVMTLLRHGADVHAVDQFGDDLLNTALTMEQFVSAELLVEKEANLWLVTGAGVLNVWLLNKATVLELTREERAARDRLLARAKRANLPWPPPDPQVVREKILGKQWPTPQMTLAGLQISSAALKDIESRFGSE
jgi:hypothetical protein